MVRKQRGKVKIGADEREEDEKKAPCIQPEITRAQRLANRCSVHAGRQGI